MWNINVQNLVSGNNNITLTKDSVINNTVSLFLKINGNSSTLNFVINENIITTTINVSVQGTYQIILKDGSENSKFTLQYNISPSLQALNLNITSYYNSGKLTLYINNSNTLKNDVNLSITGDIKKNMIFPAGSKQVQITTSTILVSTKKVLNIIINYIPYSVMVINPASYPTSLVRVTNGLKINKTCSDDITVIYNNTSYIIPKNTTQLNIQYTQGNFFVYVDSILLFEQFISISNFIPQLVISAQPLKIKINGTSNLNVNVTINSVNFTIPAGQTETPINLNLQSGVNKLVINSIANATVSKTIWYVVS